MLIDALGRPPQAPAMVRRAHVLSRADLLAARALMQTIDTTGHVPTGMTIDRLASTAAMPDARPGRVATGVPAIARASGTPGTFAQFQQWPWCAVGLVKVGHFDGPKRVHDASGSGVLVGRWLMLTAGHVAPWKQMHAGNWWMEFFPAHYGDPSGPFGGPSATFGSANVHTWWGIEDKTPDDTT